MADTVAINVVDMTVPALNHINIAVINQPNPVSNYDATGYEVSKLIQIPKYKITDSATGKVINGTNIYDYFPDLDPGGGGGGGGGDSYTKAETNALLAGKVNKETGKGLSQENYTSAEKSKLAGIAPNATAVTVDSTVTQDSNNPVSSAGIYSYIASMPISADDNVTENSSNPVKSSGIYSFVNNTIGGLDVAAVGGNGKYISAISEADGKISATETTMDTAPVEDSVKSITSGAVYTAISTIESTIGDINTVLEEVL
jgi:hypothetical protein